MVRDFMSTRVVLPKGDIKYPGIFQKKVVTEPEKVKTQLALCYDYFLCKHPMNFLVESASNFLRIHTSELKEELRTLVKQNFADTLRLFQEENVELNQDYFEERRLENRENTIIVTQDKPEYR